MTTKTIKTNEALSPGYIFNPKKKAQESAIIARQIEEYQKRKAQAETSFH